MSPVQEDLQSSSISYRTTTKTRKETEGQRILSITTVTVIGMSHVRKTQTSLRTSNYMVSKYFNYGCRAYEMRVGKFSLKVKYQGKVCVRRGRRKETKKKKKGRRKL